MRDIRRSKVPFVSQGPVPVAVSAEPLEGRRLFAGFVPHHGGGEYGSPGIVVGLMMPGRMPPSTTWQGGLFGGGRVLVVNDGITVTALSVSASAVESSVSGVSVSPNSSTPAATPARIQPANVLNKSQPAAAPVAAVVQQVMNAAATPEATATADTARPATAVAEPTFGPFAVKSSDTQTPAKQTVESGLVNLLAINAERSARLNQWTVDSLTRGRRDTGERSAEIDEGTLPTINAEAAVMQAALPMLPGDTSMRPAWQRVAIFTAGGVIVAANWIVRRRQRRLAAGLMRQA